MSRVGGRCPKCKLGALGTEVEVLCVKSYEEVRVPYVKLKCACGNIWKTTNKNILRIMRRKDYEI